MTFVTSVEGNTVLVKPLGSNDQPVSDAPNPVDNPDGVRRFPYNTDEELARILGALRDEGVAFVNAEAGWPPAGVFEWLRTRGLVSGPYLELIFSGPGKWSTRSK